MSDADIRQIGEGQVRQGRARGRRRRQRLLRRASPDVRPIPITSKLYTAERDRVRACRGRGRFARLRQSDRARRAQGRRDRARSGLGRRHRCAALGPARGTDGQGLRSRHDRRDAGPRPRESAQGRRGECRVPEGRDRADPAARGERGRDHLQLRDQSLRRQGSRARRGLPRAQAGRAASRCPTSWCAERYRPPSGAASSSGSAAWRARSRSRSTATSSPRPASPRSTWSRPASTGWKTPRNSWPARVSTPSPSPPGGRQVHERVRSRAEAPVCLTPPVEGR